MKNSLQHIVDYLKGQRKGSAANRVEREAMQDPFLAEALSGYEKHAGAHAETILRLQTQVKGARKKRRNAIAWWATAAGIAALLGIGILLNLPQTNTRAPETIAVVADTISTHRMAQQPDRTPTDTLENAEITAPNVLAENTARPKLPAPVIQKTIPPAAEEPAETIDEESIALASATTLIADTAPPPAIVVAEREQAMLAQKETAPPATRPISGVVMEDGHPLPGAIVTVKGASQSVAADLDGHYTINAPEDATLVASFIGMKTQEIPVTNKANVEINMVADATALNEVVIIAYGTSSKQSFTGSAVLAEYSQGTNISVAEGLQGQVSGLTVQTSSLSKDLESEKSITIRGMASMASNNTPLYIVDGRYVSNEQLETLNYYNIESVSVLKGESATDMYGARAADGVVLVTTKKTEEEKTPVPVIGKKRYAQYLKDSVQQPTDSLCANAKGKVRLAFYVDEDGMPYDITVTKSLCRTCDEEAIRLIEEGSEWTPGGRQVKQTVRFPGKKD